MPITTTIPIQHTAESRLPGLDINNLPFGTTPTDHLFIARYTAGEWAEARIEPFHQLTMSPFALCFHYGQTVFEGMKAFRMEDGNVSIFRLQKHHERFNRSLQRMNMPEVPYELFKEGMRQLVGLDRQWVPSGKESALYIRPFMIATEERLKVKTSDEYLFLIVCTPVGHYYAQPVRVKVETEFIRAADGGTGYAKCGGNYGGALLPTQRAMEAGYDQVLWTDAQNREFIEESGTMNVLFLIDGILITPPLSSTILDGVTRDSILQLAQARGIKVQERKISIRELEAALQSDTRVEAFGAGTAAVVAPIESIAIGKKTYACYVGEDAAMYSFKAELQAIRRGIAEDVWGWNEVV
ncbi:MAG: branched-chain amino acid aminotransferase [Lewinellaceae bacterium]|nr:branched-chain amino acid aminotransferase [Phaeodactylibacter sp.]MCB9035618.1 branched-chain amino acid aminotransferase [Lewinellaceae bacterium]